MRPPSYSQINTVVTPVGRLFQALIILEKGGVFIHPLCCIWPEETVGFSCLTGIRSENGTVSSVYWVVLILNNMTRCWFIPLFSLGGGGPIQAVNHICNNNT